MHQAIATALEPPLPGWLVRRGGFLPGMAETGKQIQRYAGYWRDLAELALRADAGFGSPAGVDRPRKPPILVALGDSLAQGIGASHPEYGYVGRVRRELAGQDSLSPVLNLSRSGARIADVLEIQLPALAAVDDPLGLIICTVGSNDLVRSTRLGRAKRELSDLLEALPESAILATVPDRGSVAATLFNRHLRREADLLSIPVADVAAYLTTWRGHRAADRFHPNDQGYQIWVDAFSEQLIPAMA